MKIIFAFLKKESLIAIRMEKKQMAWLLVCSIVMPFIINLNNTTIGIVQYSPEVLEVLGMVFVALVPFMIAVEITTQSMIAEKRDNMTEFVYNQGINKFVFIISKMCLPFILSMVGLFIATFVYSVFANPLADLSVISAILLMGICTALTTILISILIFFFVESSERYLLVCALGGTIYVVLIAAISNFAANHLLNSSIWFAVLSMVSIGTLILLNHHILVKKETALHFESIK